MAKKATQTKVAKSKKPAAKFIAKSAAGISNPGELCLILLDQLSLSPGNVHKVPSSATDDAELLASIRENGIKQNLVVHYSTNGAYCVDAGGRRLKALKRLADDNVIPPRSPNPLFGRRRA